MAGYSEELEEIKTFLRNNPKGLTVKEISEKLEINRNSVAKYLDVMEASGHIEKKQIGPAKLYFLSQKIPLSAMLNASSDFIFVLDKNNNVIQISDNLLEYLKEKKENIVGKNIMEIKNYVFSHKVLINNIQSAHESIFDIALPHRNGEHYLKVKIISTVFEDTSPGLTVIMEDITETVNAEIALKESEEKFRNIAENSPNMIFINKSGRVVFANKRCEDMGYTRNEFYSVDFNFMSLIAPESRDLIKQNIAKHMSGKEVDPYEYKLVKKNGEKLDSIINVKLINFEGSHAILGIVTDITDRKKYEQYLAESEETYRKTLDFMADPVHIIDKNHTVTYCNKALIEFHKMLGLTTEVIQKKLFSLYPFLKDGVEEEYNQVFASKKPLVSSDETKLSGKIIRTETRKIPIIENNIVTKVVTIMRHIQ